MRSRVGFFGGSFDPIHLGHLNVAIELAERHELDEVFVCPTSQSPFKKEKPPIASKEHRRAMVTAAISLLPTFTLLDFELQKSTPCYTIDTIRQLIAIDQQHKKNKNYFLLLGEDAIKHFHAWREVEELIKLATPLIGSRQTKSFPQKAALLSAIEKGLTQIPLMEISSTEIRDRLQKGLYCGHLLPAKVWDYIQQHQLYQKK
ncbi:MAG TPA: nicotinate-nucleotide adenylyltransferase [Rhabdochlamydiaceae bacterium]|nr:nicotinate-nucleotide adenylyltransferase [Rhabdochlamydiaceae bacterium]